MLASILIAAIGLGLEAFRFGLTRSAAAARLEQDVRRRFADAERRTKNLALAVARQSALVADASVNADRVRVLFSRVAELAQPVGGSQLSATVYVPAGPAGQYRVLAWSDGPAEDLPADRLAGIRPFFIVQGTVGLRVVYLAPIETEHDRRRVGIAAAETVLSPETPPRSKRYELASSLGPVTLVPLYGDAGPLTPQPERFVIASDDGRPLLEVRYSADEIARRRHVFRARVLAVAALPLVLLLLLSTGPILERRHHAKSTLEWLGWSLFACGVLVAAGGALAGLLVALRAPVAALYSLAGLTALGIVVLLVVSLLWRPTRRVSAMARPVQFVAEHLAGGMLLAAAVATAAEVLQSRIAPATLETWQFPLLPVRVSNLLYLTGLLLIQIAIGWFVAVVLAKLTERWRVTWRQPARGFVVAVLWLIPTVVLATTGRLPAPITTTTWIVAAATATVFALIAMSVRRRYRRTSQAMRLLLLFSALVVPPVAFYPMAAVFADRAARELIERDYGPVTAQLPQRLWHDLARTQQEITGLGNLVALVSGERPAAGAADQSLAFELWKQTTLATTRATSEIELYGPDRTLISHFALNVPALEAADGLVPARWNGTSCDWAVFAEGVRFGSDERTVFNAERGICDAGDQIRGAVIVRVVLDYAALPFLASTSPYDGSLVETTSTPESRLLDLQVVVYGWSLHPLFTSSAVAWPITEEVFGRQYASREPFWIAIPAGGRDFAVYFQNDRTSIYALGYPLPTLRDHTTRLAETAAVTAGLFIALLAGAALYAPFARRREAPLRVLFDEIRRSFHRKIFLFFVLAAVGPVLLFALAFGAYMTDRLREDVRTEAASVVTVARRVFEEIAAADPAVDRSRPAPTDDVMVWIRQVINQDVNLYIGSQLVSSSQRDLFDTGVLPTRTPAAVYREVVLGRVPVHVAEDRSGASHYLVAAAAVTAQGADAVLSVPLALRQRDIEHEIDELNRGVLVGAVLVILFAANLGAAVAGKFSDRVAGLTRATRLIAAGRLDVRVPVDTADELGRLGDDFNSMSATLAEQRAELARTNQIKAWAEMARQVAHEIKNPLTPIQLAAEHLQRVHDDERRPLGAVLDQCVSTMLRQVRLLRQIASEFANFAGDPSPHPAAIPAPELIDGVIGPYRLGLGDRTRIVVSVDPATPVLWVDRTLIARALTNLVENAVQAMPSGGLLTVTATAVPRGVQITLVDTGVGMDAAAVARAFEPYFSTKTAGSGLGLANAKRNIERSGGTIHLESAPGAGTTVTVVLPAAVGAHGPDVPASA